MGRLERRIEIVIADTKKQRVSDIRQQNYHTMQMDHSTGSPTILSDDKEVVRQVRAKLGPVARCLYTKDGSILLRDQHPDIAMRYLFPISYGISLLVLFSRVPAQPGQAPFLDAGCM